MVSVMVRFTVAGVAAVQHRRAAEGVGMKRLRRACESESTGAADKCDSVRPVSAVSRLTGPFFVLAGLMHFVIPKAYRRIVPPYIPAPAAAVYASGLAEIAGGAGLMLGRRRRLAGWWLIATLAAVFPANVHMALHPDEFPRVPGGAVSLWARLPFQGVFVAWVLAAMRRSD
jgi:uncharacterized membrane protein